MTKLSLFLEGGLFPPYVFLQENMATLKEVCLETAEWKPPVFSRLRGFTALWPYAAIKTAQATYKKSFRAFLPARISVQASSVSVLVSACNRSGGQVLKTQTYSAGKTKTFMTWPCGMGGLCSYVSLGVTDASPVIFLSSLSYFIMIKCYTYYY